MSTRESMPARSSTGCAPPARTTSCCSAGRPGPGSQRFGVAVWSADIDSTFASLRSQVRAGLNMAVSGIPWWTHDIGGFRGGDPANAEFRELLVRWFQFGAFSPIFRMHGHRLPHVNDFAGGPNEVWSFGEEAYGILRGYLALRERLRPYVMSLMKAAHEDGIPPMRPLFLEFPEDPTCYDVEDQYLFGPDLLVAPILEAGARSRTVYLPTGPTWTDAWTGAAHDGGQTIVVDAPLERIPLFLRDGAHLPIDPDVGGVGRPATSVLCPRDHDHGRMPVSRYPSITAPGARSGQDRPGEASRLARVIRSPHTKQGVRCCSRASDALRAPHVLSRDMSDTRRVGTWRHPRSQTCVSPSPETCCASTCGRARCGGSEDLASVQGDDRQLALVDDGQDPPADRPRSADPPAHVARVPLDRPRELDRRTRVASWNTRWPRSDPWS